LNNRRHEATAKMLIPMVGPSAASIGAATSSQKLAMPFFEALNRAQPGF
jgi:hypothetical protein